MKELRLRIIEEKIELNSYKNSNSSLAAIANILNKEVSYTACDVISQYRIEHSSTSHDIYLIKFWNSSDKYLFISFDIGNVLSILKEIAKKEFEKYSENKVLMLGIENPKDLFNVIYSKLYNKFINDKIIPSELFKDKDIEISGINEKVIIDNIHVRSIVNNSSKIYTYTLNNTFDKLSAKEVFEKFKKNMNNNDNYKVDIIHTNDGREYFVGIKEYYDKELYKTFETDSKEYINKAKADFTNFNEELWLKKIKEFGLYYIYSIDGSEYTYFDNIDGQVYKAFRIN